MFAVFYYLAKKYFKKERGYLFYLLLIPMLFCLAEALDPKIFKWFLGDALTSYKYMVQFADVLGVSGLSFLIFIFNVSVFLIIKRKYFVPAALCVVIPLFLFVYGKQTYSNLKDVQEKCPLIRAGVVQANIGNPIQLSIAQAMKFKSELGYGNSPYVNDMTLILKKYRTMTYSLKEANKDVDLIVWPETAFPSYYIDKSEFALEHKKMVAALDLPFLIG
jgi:apolipoprotein N-acyltransferase